jgi:O-antigen/teichoic acid export membrane protein
VPEEQLKKPTQIRSQGKFARQLSLFSAARVLGALLGLLRSYVIAKWLGPSAFGTWQFVNLYDRYSVYSGLGTRPALHRRIPFLRGRNDLEGMRAVLTTSFTINFSGPIIYSLIVLGISFSIKEAFDAKALAAFAPVILLLTWMDYARLLSMATGYYSFRSRLEVQHDILFTLLSIGLVFVGGIYGVIAALGVASLINIIYSFRKLRNFCGFGINWKILRDLIVTGFPLTANGFLLTLMNTADKSLIAAMIDRETLGVYGVAYAGINVLRAIPVSLGQMIFVKFAEMDGKKASKAHILRTLDKTTTTLSCLFAPIVSAAIAYFPVIITFLLPKFISGIPSGIYLLTSLYFLGISLPSTNWCMATGRFMPVLLLRIMAVIIEYISIYLFISNGARLEFTALSVLFASAIFSTSIAVVCNYILGSSFKNGILHICKNMLPFLSILIVISAQNYYSHANIYTPGMQLIIYSTLGFVSSLVVSIPLVYWANKRTQFIEQIWPKTSLRFGKTPS